MTVVGVIAGLVIAFAVAVWFAAVGYVAVEEVKMDECREHGGTVVLSDHGYGWSCE